MSRFSLVLALCAFGLGSPAASAQSPGIGGTLTEHFDDVTALPGSGWALVNNSEPAGPTTWFQGRPFVFPAQAGDPSAYIASDVNAATGADTISVWLLTPDLVLANGAVIRFHTRTVSGSAFPDRLQVRMSTAGASLDVGTTNASVGAFTTLLEDINAGLAPGGYPEAWTEYAVTVSGLPASLTRGRVAFRYFVPNGGPGGVNSTYIGIDEVSVTAAVIGGPLLTADVSEIVFGPVVVGQTSPGEPVTLSNSGDAPATITAITATAPFDVVDPGFPIVVPAGGSRTVAVTFSPTAVGPASGTVTVTSDALDSPTVALTGTGTLPPPGSYASTDTPRAIPDDAPAGVVSTIVVPSSAPDVADLDVAVEVEHTYVGNLALSLARGSDTVTLADRPGAPATASGCSRNNMILTFDDEGNDGAAEATCLGATDDDAAYVSGGRYTPDSPLSVFDGTPAAGTYTLTVSDLATPDEGTLFAWALLVSVAVAGEGSASATASRLQVAPNPLAGQGQIDLTVATAQDVRVVLFDALGREVQVLLDRAMTAGQQAYIGFSTQGLPAGVYVVRAIGTDVNLTQRVTVVR